MKINHLLFISVLALASCTTSQEKATEQPQQPVQTSEVVDYKPMANPIKKEKFAQINIVVGDIYKAAKAWAAI